MNKVKKIPFPPIISLREHEGKEDLSDKKITSYVFVLLFWVNPLAT